jgi:phosphoribosylamine--glycine ligase
MIADSGPRVLEFNTRFGDPECQALMRRMKSDLLPILLACAEGKLASITEPEWDVRSCVGVIAAAEGYPATPRKNDPIDGIEDAELVPDVVVFHAGTARSMRGDVVTSGGRVLCVTALGDDVAAARARAYEAYDQIHYDGKFCRRDIGARKKKEAPPSDDHEAESPRPRDEGRPRGAAKRPPPRRSPLS